MRFLLPNLVTVRDKKGPVLSRGIWWSFYSLKLVTNTDKKGPVLDRGLWWGFYSQKLVTIRDKKGPMPIMGLSWGFYSKFLYIGTVKKWHLLLAPLESPKSAWHHQQILDTYLSFYIDQVCRNDRVDQNDQTIKIEFYIRKIDSRA